MCGNRIQLETPNEVWYATISKVEKRRNVGGQCLFDKLAKKQPKNDWNQYTKTND